MIWTKTPRGLGEIAARCSHVDPASRNLLRLIDGAKTEEMLLRHGIGVVQKQFRELWTAGLIEPVIEPEQTSGRTEVRPEPMGVRDPKPLAKVLSQLISVELGFAGLGFAEKVSQARSVHELHSVADAVIAKIRERKGNAVAEAAWKRLVPQL